MESFKESMNTRQKQLLHMVKVKINNKTYNVPELQFGDYTHMESQGISITEAFSRGQMTLIAMAFT